MSREVMSWCQESGSQLIETRNALVAERETRGSDRMQQLAGLQFWSISIFGTGNRCSAVANTAARSPHTYRALECGLQISLQA